MEFVWSSRVYEVDWDILFQGDGGRGKTTRFRDMPEVTSFKEDDP